MDEPKKKKCVFFPYQTKNKKQIYFNRVGLINTSMFYYMWGKKISDHQLFTNTD